MSTRGYGISEGNHTCRKNRAMCIEERNKTGSERRGKTTASKSGRTTFHNVPDPNSTARWATATYLLCILPFSLVVCGCSSGRPSGERDSHWARRCCSRLYSRSSARRVPGQAEKPENVETSLLKQPKFFKKPSQAVLFAQLY